MRKLASWRKLEGQQQHIIMPPWIMAEMSGTRQAFQTGSGAIGLVYSDGTQQVRDGRDYDIRDFVNYFGIVTFVQEGVAPHGMPLYDLPGEEVEA